MANDSDFAIVVGINDYETFSPLHGAVNDAEYFYDWLVSPQGGDVPPANITKIVSTGTNIEPRRDQIENKIVRYIRDYKSYGHPIGRRLYLFFAGHGIDVGNLEDCGLVMADANELLPDRAIPGRVVATAFKHSHAFEEVVLFMDCCREVTMQNPLSGELPILTNLPKLANSRSRMLQGLATQWRQLAGERTLPTPDGTGESVQGVFTYALLDGLKRAAGPDGVLTGNQLKNYVRTLMRILEAVGSPVIDVEPEDIVMCTPGPGSTQTLITTPADQTDFDVRDGGNRYVLVHGPRTRVGPDTWSIRLRPGLYYVGAPSGREINAYDVWKEVTVVGPEFLVEL